MRMKNLLTLTAATVLTAGLCLAPVKAGAAAPDAGAAVKAYEEMLSGDTIDWSDVEEENKTSKLSFLCHDIDLDGIPELIVQNAEASNASCDKRIYTYKNGKIKTVTSTNDSIFIYEKKGLICFVGEQTGSNWTTYEKLKNGKLHEKVSMTGTTIKDMIPKESETMEIDPGVSDVIYYYSFTVNKKEATVSETQTAVKKLEKNNMIVESGNYYKNNSENRTKYLTAEK